MQNRTKLMIYGLIIFLTVLAAGAVWFRVAMSGGIYSIILNMRSRPDLDSSNLQLNRTRLAEQIDADFSGAIGNLGLARYQATSTQDTCYDGANNWKHQDGFAHRCTLRVMNFYGVDGDFRKTMMDIEKTLLASGWRSNNYDNTPNMEWSLDNKFVFAEGRRTERHLSPNPGNIYSYYKDELSLDIRSAERGATSLGSLEIMQAHSMGWIIENSFYDQRKFADVEEAFREVTRDHTYILGIAISGHYFEN
jgi:hypothetical protein